MKKIEFDDYRDALLMSIGEVRGEGRAKLNAAMEALSLYDHSKICQGRDKPAKGVRLKKDGTPRKKPGRKPQKKKAEATTNASQ